MSEYQFVAFRAIDRPVSKQNLAYMRQQSTRAEISPWSFENEYHYGDFRGNAEEMLRRGYDIHLHYANFGVRRLLIRLPPGRPSIAEIKPYLGEDFLQFSKDKNGTGGILAIEPYLEPDTLEELWEVDSFLDRLMEIRTEILEGDLRPLYLAHLAMACDLNHDPEETTEAPVPAGLGALTDAQQALAEFYGLDDSLIAAAAEASPPLPKQGDSSKGYAQWLDEQPEQKKNAWLAAWMADAASPARAEMLAEYKSARDMPKWPTAEPKRTIAQLQAAATEIADKARKRAAAQQARQRAKRLADMAENPTATLRETEKLVAERTTDAYRQVAELLADLREALASSGKSQLAEQHAQKLRAANPTLRVLVSELRRQGFLPK
jgi:hypothetical protein